MTHAYFVILAGGSGERLWPLSSPARPKQLIPFINGITLLEQTIVRIQSLIRSKNHLFILTNTDQQEAIKKIVGKQGSVIVEPIGRNTAPAIASACAELYEKNPDAVIAILPSDHFIPESENIHALLTAAIAYASFYDKLVLLGIKPTFAATGYGYIQYTSTQQISGWTCYPIEHFHEKPDKEKAQEYLEKDGIAWNIGIFVGKVKTFIQEFETHAPNLWQNIQDYRSDKKKYDEIEPISIDHAIMEKSNNLVIFPAQFAWHDVGNLTTFLSLKMQYEKTGSAEIVNVNGQDNIAYAAKKTVAFVGVSNICLVESENEIIVVAQDQVESVRKVLTSLR